MSSLAYEYCLIHKAIHEFPLLCLKLSESKSHESEIFVLY